MTGAQALAAIIDNLSRRRTLWRIGTGEWEHVDTNHA